MVHLFFLSFFALWNFEFPAKIKKGGGGRPTGPPTYASWEGDLQIPPVSIERSSIILVSTRFCATEKGHLHLLICDRYLIPHFDLYRSYLIAEFLRLQTYHLINTFPEGPHCAGFGASLGGPNTLKCIL